MCVLSFCSAELSEPVATGHLVAVVNNPTVSLRRSTGIGTDVLQAVLVERIENDMEGTLLVLRASVSPSKPPQVASATIEVYPVDPGVLDDQCAIAKELEGWWRDYAVRELTPAPHGALKSWVWMGNPSASGYRDVPSNWEAQVQVAGSVLGLRTFIAKSVDEARTQAFHERADLIIGLQGLRWWESLEQLITGTSLELLAVGDAGSAFQSLLERVRELLLPRRSYPGAAIRLLKG